MSSPPTAFLGLFLTLTLTLPLSLLVGYRLWALALSVCPGLLHHHVSKSKPWLPPPLPRVLNPPPAILLRYGKKHLLRELTS